jgi:hypothetical protein
MLSKQNGFCYKVECLSPILLVLQQLNGNQEICIKIQYLVRIIIYYYMIMNYWVSDYDYECIILG